MTPSDRRARAHEVNSDVTSVPDAVDGSSTRASAMDVGQLLGLPRFEGAIHANGYDNGSRHRQVGLSSSWR
jgi:hypothetical protein